MINALVALLVIVLVIGIVYFLVSKLVDMLPIDANFKQIINILLILICVLIILARALPLLGINVLG